MKVANNFLAAYTYLDFRPGGEIGRHTRFRFWGRKVMQVRVLSRAKKSSPFGELFFCPGSKPTIWLASGLDVGALQRANRLSRAVRAPRSPGRKESCFASLFFCPGSQANNYSISAKRSWCSCKIAAIFPSREPASRGSALSMAYMSIKSQLCTNL